MFVPRNREELDRDFRDTFLRLVRAGANFDEGHEYEAAGIAAAVYVLVHEGGKRSPSLLTLLGKKAGLRFVDSATPLNPNNLLTEAPLTMTLVSQGNFRYVAIRNLGPPFNIPPAAFPNWWEKPVLRDVKRREFSRKNLIHFFRHSRGGGHVGRQHEPQDSVPAQAFSDMSLRDPAGWSFTNGTQTFVPEYGADYASVRQIGWEIEQTLRINCAGLIPTASDANGMRAV